MTDDMLRDVAANAGIEVTWTDVHGRARRITPDVLRAVLTALGSAGRHRQRTAPLITAEASQPIVLPAIHGRYRLRLESGDIRDAVAQEAEGDVTVLPPIDEPGYHRLELGQRAITIANAPRRCFTILGATGLRRSWGLTAQLYALRRPGDGGIGDFTALEDLARSAGAAGAAAIAVSPMHAQFAADPGKISPYTPSSRMMLNVLHADPGIAMADPELDQPGGLLDWPSAAAVRLAALRQTFLRARQERGVQWRNFQQFCLSFGEDVWRHATFEALHETRFGADPAEWNWHNWPTELHGPDTTAVREFAAEHPESVEFHAFLQFLADCGLQAAQRAGRAAGMAIGLIADVAVGVEPGGSDAWCHHRQLLRGLTIGAPPDMYNTAGQAWGVTSFSPHGLIESGYAAFLAMLRAALRHAGGVRLDHVMSLARLWVIPQGNPPTEGAYLRFPVDDLLRLVRLESWRHRAIVIGEDLGTLPDGFRTRLRDAGLAGMRVMWFERDGGRFTPPADWSQDAVAMTSTHDLPTVAGWWSGHDLDVRAGLGMGGSPTDRAERERDRAALWAAFCASGAAQAEQPPPEATASAVDAACAHIGGAACALALLPLEDAMGQDEQMNLPGTVDEHPNWRRRLPRAAGTALQEPVVAARLRALADARA